MDKVPAKLAVYMELPGAVKDADCSRVEVKGGVSNELGCCDLWEWEKDSGKFFRCGTCKYTEAKESRSRPSSLDRLRREHH